MSTLTIKDLCLTKDLDRDAMASVHGGEGKSMAQVAAETVTLLNQIASGECEFSSTGKSYVCY
ncbi:hypothetical protein [Paraburkholderia sp.]|uniref:hypothetical protein n=1 Tax=Paraburkholderia sp. TaxID=1926495 RepID=UPI0039E3EB3E